MNYYYDIYGWLTTEVLEGRSTSIVPPEPQGSKRPNFTGYKWILLEYSEPTAQPEKTKIEELEEQLELIKQELDLLKGI